MYSIRLPRIKYFANEITEQNDIILPILIAYRDFENHNELLSKLSHDMIDLD